MAISDNGEKTRIAIIAVCSLIFVGLVIAQVVGFTTKNTRGEPRRNGNDNDNDDDNDNDNDDNNVKLSDSVKAIRSICRPTDFQRTCEEEICIEARESADVKEIVQAAFRAGAKFATHAENNSTSLRERTRDPRTKLALENCRELLTYSVFEFQKAIRKVDELELGNFDRVLEDLKILLSATITNQETCLNGFRNGSKVFEEHMRETLKMSMRLSKIGLTIAWELSDMVNQLEFQGLSHRLLGRADSLRRRLLLQGEEIHVLGHMDSASMMDKDPWERTSDTQQERLIRGHEDLSSLLDETNLWKRRLLQEKDHHDGDLVYVDGHDDYIGTIGKRRLLQEEGPYGHFVYVDGQDGYRVNQNKRRLLQRHGNYGSTLHKRSLYQENEPNGHYVYVDDYGAAAAPSKRRLLQEKDSHDGNLVYVDGHDDYNSIHNKRRLLQEKESHVGGRKDYVDGHDDYITVLDKRRLFEEKKPSDHDHRDWSSRLENDPSKLKPDVVVAKDGSGDFKTIEDAVTRIHHDGQKPFVIYIKKGIYQENIIFNYNLTNIALIGDGKEDTRITGSLDFADGLNTFNTATVAVHGDFFYAKNIGFENTAGAAKLQAVALMVISDFAVLFNCSIDGHQNTLYVHSKRQFYRDCTISGTIDFVFGDAAAIFQNCKFKVRKPLEGQENVVTAQGRSDERQPTGIIIQNSTIVADDDFAHLKNRQPTFLGRPRGNFSRTIIMETFMDDLIDREGWTVGDDHCGLETGYFSEYNNRGLGSGTSGRVTWSAIKKLSPTTAHGFTLGKFFLGDYWIKAKGVPCTSGFSESQTRKLNMKVPFVLAADN
ncbi:hypothetical protein GQ457_06G023680 [Hibiscus cannabinus]